MKKITVMVVMLLVCLNIIANVETAWMNQTEGLGGVDIAVDSDTNSYVLTSNCNLIKYSITGEELFFIQNLDDLYYSKMILDNEDNIYIAGYNIGLVGEKGIYIQKYDSDGNLIWQSVYEFGWYEGYELSNFEMDDDGNLLVLGSYVDSENYPSLDSRTLIIKYDQDGNELWNHYELRYYGDIVYVKNVAVSDDGSIYVITTEENETEYSYEPVCSVIYKFNSEGTFCWEIPSEILNGTEGEKISFIGESEIIATISAGAGLTGYLVLIKINSDGEILFENEVAGEYDIIQEVDNQQNIVIGSFVFQPGENRYELTKYDPEGSIICSTQTFFKVIDLTFDQEDNIYMTGFYNGNLFSAKYDSNLNHVWTTAYGSYGSDRETGNAIVIDDQNNVIVTGAIDSEDNSTDCITIMYNETTAIEENDLSVEADIMNVYPNPFSFNSSKRSNLIIAFSLKNSCDAKVSIYNLKGQNIKTIKQQNLNSGEQSIIWDGKDKYNKKINTGIYFITLEMNNQIIAKHKVMVIK